jgi:spermidine synthase
MAEPGAPLAVVHLGAGGLSVARYVAAIRPGSRQRAVEVSAEVADEVRRHLPLPRGARVPVQVADAREALGRMRDASADLVVLDVFSGAVTPAHLTTVEMAQEMARVLRPAGVVAVNVADGPGLPFARGQAATYRAVFDRVVVMVEPGVWRGRRFGNLVLVASNGPLPVAALTRSCAGDPQPARVVSGGAVEGFATSAVPVRDGAATDSPQPPADLFAPR